MKIQYLLNISVLIVMANFISTIAQIVKNDSSLKTQDLVLEISCNKSEFIEGEPIDILIKISNNANDTVNVYLNHYLLNLKNDSTSRHSFSKGIYIPAGERYYLIIDPAGWWMFTGNMDLSTISLKPGNYVYYISTTYPNKRYESNRLKIVVNPVPDSLLESYNDLKYIPNHSMPIDTAEAHLEKYKGSFYEERFYAKVFGYGNYYYAIQNKDEFKDYRDKAINLYREFILKYPNSSNAYGKFQVIMYNYKENALLVNEILSNLNYNQPNCKLLECLRNQPDYRYKQIKYLLN